MTLQNRKILLFLHNFLELNQIFSTSFRKTSTHDYRSTTMLYCWKNTFIIPSSLGFLSSHQHVSSIWPKIIWWWVSSDAETLENSECPFIATDYRSTLAQSGSTWSVQIELNCVLMLNWIVSNWTVFDIETVLRQTELFEIELFWCLDICKQNLSLY